MDSRWTNLDCGANPRVCLFAGCGHSRVTVRNARRQNFLSDTSRRPGLRSPNIQQERRRSGSRIGVFAIHSDSCHGRGRRNEDDIRFKDQLRRSGASRRILARKLILRVTKPRPPRIYEVGARAHTNTPTYKPTNRGSRRFLDTDRGQGGALAVRSCVYFAARYSPTPQLLFGGIDISRGNKQTPLVCMCVGVCKRCQAESARPCGFAHLLWSGSPLPRGGQRSSEALVTKATGRGQKRPPADGDGNS